MRRDGEDEATGPHAEEQRKKEREATVFRLCRRTGRTLPGAAPAVTGRERRREKKRRTQNATQQTRERQSFESDIEYDSDTQSERRTASVEARPRDEKKNKIQMIK